MAIDSKSDKILSLIVECLLITFVSLWLGTLIFCHKDSIDNPMFTVGEEVIVHNFYTGYVIRVGPLEPAFKIKYFDGRGDIQVDWFYTFEIRKGKPNGDGTRLESG